MNFYDFHIGDYASRTAHLEPMEDLAYRRMLDLYYVREEALPLDVAEIARLIRLRGQEAVIKAVLGEFFAMTDAEDAWIHDRCEAVIAAAQDKRAKAQASAALRWSKERTATAEPTHSERIADALPTVSEGNAPSPSPSPIKNTGAVAQPPVGVSPAVWKDFQKTRKTKITETGLALIAKEAHKAGLSLEQALSECCARGWRGFKAEWLTSGRASPTSTVPGPAGPDPALEKIKADAKLAVPIPKSERERWAKLKVAH